MTDQNQPIFRLAKYLNMAFQDPQLHRAAAAFFRERDAVKARFPLLSLMYGVAENECEPGADMLSAFEGILWEAYWVDSFCSHSDCVDQCRRKLSMLLSVLVDPEFKHFHDPNLVAWSVVALLKVERTARASGLRRLFRPPEVELLDALLRDCEQHAAERRWLPNDLEEKLRVLEGRGIFLPSDLQAVIRVFRPAKS
jgi:hypothetical protein